MNAPTASGFSRFHAIVAATPRDAFGPPVIDDELLQQTEYATTSDTPLTKKRKRGQDDAATQQGRSSATRSRVRLYQNHQQLLSALREQFQQGSDVEFHGYYEIEEAGVSHKQRIQTLTHEIWRTTGYRFTVKDHPKINNGHKTRFWCSQDQAHKNKLKGARLSGDVPKPRLTSAGDVMAKTRYPCRSRLLISSRDSDADDRRIITIRLAHHVAHEPYLDASLPPEVSKSICETFGWLAHEHPSFSEGSSGRSTFVNAVVHTQLPTAIAPSQLHQPPQPLEMEDDDDDDDDDDGDLGPDDDENESGNFGIPVEVLSGQSTANCRSETTSVPTPSLMQLPPTPMPPSSHPDIYHQRMRCHIANIREFCDGLDYQLQFNDTRMLGVVEKEGASFLNLVEDCLRKEGRLVSVPSEHNNNSNGISPPIAGPSHPDRPMLNGRNGFS